MHPLDILVISPAWTMLKSASVVQLQSRFGRICTSVCLNWRRPTQCEAPDFDAPTPGQHEQVMETNPS